MTAWPFEDPENVVTVTVEQIVNGEKPILLVCHEEEDGCWQFLTGGTFEMKHAMLVALKEIVARDSSVLELADLPLGWQAIRNDRGSAWQRSRI